jgi:hypothetical protein
VEWVTVYLTNGQLGMHCGMGGLAVETATKAAARVRIMMSLRMVVKAP